VIVVGDSPAVSSPRSAVLCRLTLSLIPPDAPRPPHARPPAEAALPGHAPHRPDRRGHAPRRERRQVPMLWRSGPLSR